jgi:hypothetical protein
MKVSKACCPLLLILLSITVIITFQRFSIFPISDTSHHGLERNKLRLNDIAFSNMTVISDGFNGTYWNNELSEYPKIVADSTNKIHVVWEDSTNGVWGTDMEIMYACHSPETGWSKVEVISDGYNGSYWNIAQSSNPAIAVDSKDIVHVVYEDFSKGVWGSKSEIMHVSYTPHIGWSNITVVSDGYDGIYWNDGFNLDPDIAIDSEDNIHVVWNSDAEGIWGSDVEIMYVKYTQGIGWSNVSIISDGNNGIYWNDGLSEYPSIAVDDNEVHVVWQDSSDGFWGTDKEIMYIKYTPSSGWSGFSIISEGHITNLHNYWNDGDSKVPAIACFNGEIHIVWEDDTNGVWGEDYEIMHVKYDSISGWSGISVISDGFEGSYWNDAPSFNPEMIIDHNGNVHVVWQDYTDGIWDNGGSDNEIMYVKYTSATGWTNISVISDGYGGIYWNEGININPDLCLGSDNIYVVWQESTKGVWGTDFEIMFTCLVISPLSTLAIPTGFFFLIELIIITLGLIVYIHRKQS